MKLEAGNTETFLVDNIPRQRGDYEIFANITRFGLRRASGDFLLIDHFSTFSDNDDNGFASVQAVVDYVKVFIFV